MSNIVLSGPPSVGKSTIGKALADELGREFVDTDALIEARAGRPIPAIFAEQGEVAFRALEDATVAEVSSADNLVIAVGGGALRNPVNRRKLQHTGTIIALQANEETLLRRLAGGNGRPLLSGDAPAQRLRDLLRERHHLYNSFFETVTVDERRPGEIVADIRERLTPLERRLGPSAIRLGSGQRHSLSALLPPGPAVVICDEQVGLLWVADFAEQLGAPLITLPAGEQHKTLASIATLYDALLAHGMDRSGTVIAVGGGVIGDMAGFAAATFMRGVRWFNLPTTLLAMVDASLGGKTGVDLPQGKNLVGAFHPPELILIDPVFLETLPRPELVSGMAEVLKHGIIADPALFAHAHPDRLTRDVLAQAIQVKIDVVTRDPYEHGERACLNFGHTVGHGIEAASGFELRHGEAIAIGMVAEAEIAVRLGLAGPELPEQIAARLTDAGLPTYYGDLDPAEIRRLMQSDKKKQRGKLKFALPRHIGRVDVGLTVPDDILMNVLAQHADNL